MPDNIATDKQEQHMKQLKRRMESFREIILPLNSIILWEKSWYPALIVAFTTILFTMIWILEPAFLTLISLSLLTLALADYLAHILTSILCPANSWTRHKEKKLNQICQNLSTTILQLESIWKSILQIRNNRPNLYCGVTTACLVLAAWLGNIMNNLFLFYITANVLLLLPGFKHNRPVWSAVKYLYDNIVHKKLS